MGSSENVFQTTFLILDGVTLSVFEHGYPHQFDFYSQLKTKWYNTQL
ncbi:hypothetical protein NEISICOT_00119 [Neisseria sicca ATCC 29256]|uniref:Uncharacterized protein n=1 Tax=Neisseria sicca ATCC 29256 TaxID=547045 RepID=C6M0U4_NEISI|nr:hypothetical protein NEISICOT_00119 [Neisseria sicca ATCC 29256]